MENHPIPQDVTGFKFKLVGSVTVKQFLYLMGFGILATVAFVLPLNFVFVRIPLMVLFGGIGVSLAFLPIEGRPMDVMLMNFIRAIPSENRYLYRKKGVNLSRYAIFDRVEKQRVAAPQKTQTQTTTTTPNEDKRALLISRLRNSSFRPDDSETRAMNNIKAFFDEDNTKPERVKINQAKLAQVYSGNVIPNDSTGITHETTIASQKQALPADTPEAKTPAEEIINARRQAEEEIRAKIKAQESAKTADVIPTDMPESNLKLSGAESGNKNPGIEIPKADVGWTQSSGLPGGFPSLPDVPNVVLGLVRDSRGKTLPNVLVEVVDASGIPVRAFKTNALGQFASATPLPDGSYKIYFDDPAKQHEISPIDITLAGEIFQPIEAVSVDDRERLRRELFGGGTPAST